MLTWVLKEYILEKCTRKEVDKTSFFNGDFRISWQQRVFWDSLCFWYIFSEIFLQIFNQH
jgi:hypothetical protein